MFRFAKLDGEGFYLDFKGQIGAFNSIGELVAVLVGVHHKIKDALDTISDEPTEINMDERRFHPYDDVDDDDDDDEGDYFGLAESWDDWEIVCEKIPEKLRVVFARMVATAYSAVAACELFCVESDYMAGDVPPTK